MSDAKYLAQAAAIIDETAAMLKRDNDAALCCRHGVEFWCHDCNRRANAERINEIIRQRRLAE